MISFVTHRTALIRLVHVEKDVFVNRTMLETVLISALGGLWVRENNVEMEFKDVWFAPNKSKCSTFVFLR